MREVIPYRDFPKEVAIVIYRWLLELSKDKAKGTVRKIINKYDKANNTSIEDIWSPIANTIRSDRYYNRLLKAIVSNKIKKCPWCKYYSRGKCRADGCKYSFSMVKTSNNFNVDIKEIRFVLDFMTDEDEENLYDTISKVEKLYSSVEEHYQHEKVFVAIYNELSLKKHFDKKANQGKVLKLYGVMPEDIKQLLFETTWGIVTRYDYLPYKEQLLIVSKTLGNELVNIVRKVKDTKERFYDYGKNAVPPKIDDTGTYYTYAWDKIPDERTPEIEYLDSEREVLAKKFKDIMKDFDVIEDMFCSVLLGEPNEIFIEHLKQIKKLKTSRGWEAFYNNTSAEDIKNCLNSYFGCEVDERIRQKVDESINPKGGNSMSETKQIKVVVPKTKCVLCKYWVDWLPKKRIPTDCSPAYPGCPVHIYNLVHEFPVKAAALQLRKFIDRGEDEAVQEFMSTAPNPSSIFKAAMKLTPEEVAAALEDESDEDEVDIESMDRVEMLNLVISCQFDIPGISKMSDEELRETIIDLYERNVDEDDNSGSGKLIGDVDDDDNDDEVKVVQSIEPMKFNAGKK